MNGRISVQEVLDSVGMDLHSLLCPFCEEEVDMVDHCFLKCKFINDLWLKIFNWWGCGLG